MNAVALSQADSLRLHMLLRQPLQAVRIDESRMTVYGLSPRGEAKVELSPTGRDDLYLRRVRELLSSHVLGSPGGYPVFLQRWTRMGQARAASLERLLLLGEEEAVVAVVHASALDPELARRAWWAAPNADNARRMLEKAAVAHSDIGAELAAFLVDYLPFETDQRAIIDSIRLVLRAQRLDATGRAELWRRGETNRSYWVGFLLAEPESLPLELPAHPADSEWRALAERAPWRGHPLARAMQRLMSAPGQAWLATVAAVLAEAADQDVVVALFEALDAYFAPLRGGLPAPSRSPEQLEARVLEALRATPVGRGEIRPERAAELRALLRLAHCGEQLIAPVLGRTDAVGSVLRGQLAEAVAPVRDALVTLGQERAAGGTVSGRPRRRRRAAPGRDTGSANR